MPVICDWYDKTQTILYCRLIGHWTVEEHTDALAAVHQLLQDVSVSKRFDIILDLTESSYTPPTGTLWNWKQNLEMRDALFPNYGLSVFINTSRVIDAYFEEGVQTSDAIRLHSRFAKTLTEAIQIIQVDRAS